MTKLSLISIGLTSFEKEYAHIASEKIGSRIRRQPRIIPIGEKQANLIAKLIEANYISNDLAIKSVLRKLLRYNLKFVYHGDILLPIFNGENQYSVAMVVDMSSKSLVSHRSLVAEPHDSEKALYIGTTVSTHINTYFEKSVMEFYKSIINAATMNTFLVLEMYKTDPFVKQIEYDVEKITFIPQFDDMYVLSRNEEVHIEIKNDDSPEYVKKQLLQHFKPITFGEIQDIPFKHVDASEEKGKYIYVNQAIARKTARMIYLQNEDTIEGIKAYLQKDAIIHGDIIVPRVQGRSYMPNAMVLDMHSRIIRLARPQAKNAKWDAVYIGDTITTHISRKFGQSAFEYYKDIVADSKLDVVIQVYYPDAYIKLVDDTKLVKSLTYTKPAHELIINSNEVIQPFHPSLFNNTYGLEEIRSVVRTMKANKKETSPKTTEAAKEKCTIM